MYTMIRAILFKPENGLAFICSRLYFFFEFVGIIPEYDFLLKTWFPDTGHYEVRLADTGEEAVILHDWLRMKMVRSGVPKLVNSGSCCYSNVRFSSQRTADHHVEPQITTENCRESREYLSLATLWSLE